MLHLSFALADAARLELMFSRGRLSGFLGAQRDSRGKSWDSFDEYWAPIEAGTGQMPQAYPCPSSIEAGELFEPKFTIASQNSNQKGALQIERPRCLIGAGRA